MYQSNLKFYIKSTLTVASWTGATFDISNDLELDTPIETGSEDVSIIFKNDTQIERFTITATWWVATIVKRWLTQANSEVEETWLRKQWSDGDIWYITALAFDLIDKSWNNTFTWNNTFSESIITEKWVAWTIYADETARDVALWADWAATKAYTNIYVTSTGLFYNYNLSTAQWEDIDTWTTTPNGTNSAAWIMKVADATQIAAWTDETPAYSITTKDVVKTPDGTPSNDENKVPVLNSDGNLDDFITQIKLIIDDLTPAETLTDATYMFRKWYKTGEETDKVYKYVDGDTADKLGIIKTATDGYENPLSIFSGEELEIYWNNIFGGVVQHQEDKVSKITLNGYGVGTGTFDFLLCPFVAWELDENNPVAEELWIDLTTLPTNDSWAIPNYSNSSHTAPTSFVTVTWSEQTMANTWTLNVSFSYSCNDGTIRIVKNGITVFTEITSGAGAVNEDIEVEAGDVIKMEEAHNFSTNPMSITNISYEGTIPFFTLTFTEATIIPATDYGFILNMSWWDSSNKVVLSGDQVTDTKLLKSTAWIGAAMSAIAGGLYNKLISENPITTIKTTNKWVFITTDTLEDNTIYYLTSAGVITKDSTGNVLLWKSISENKILIQDVLDTFGEISVTATAGAVVMPNAEGYVTVNIPGVWLKKLAYFTL